MTSFSFIHAADIHLDSPLSGLSAYEGAPVELLRNAPRAAFSNLIDEAIRERVDFVNGGAKLVHPGGAKLVHLTLCGTPVLGGCPGSP